VVLAVDWLDDAGTDFRFPYALFDFFAISHDSSQFQTSSPFLENGASTASESGASSLACPPGACLIAVVRRSERRDQTDVKRYVGE
jgi:hypothetical protein